MLGSAIWRADLAANSRRSGYGGLLTALVVSPPFRAVTLARLAAHFVTKGGMGRLIAALLSRRLGHRFGCYISPRAKIGAALALPHPTAIVIGEGCVIGRNVMIYQGVTLGQKSKSDRSYPTVGDDVTIYAGAVVVGAITIGDGAVVGANAVVLSDVPPASVVVGSPARTIAGPSAHHRVRDRAT